MGNCQWETHQTNNDRYCATHRCWAQAHRNSCEIATLRETNRRLADLRDTWAHNNNRHLNMFGQHLPVGLGQAVDELTEILDTQNRR